MAKRYFLFLFLATAAVAAGAQRPAASLRAGERAMVRSDFFTALHHFRQALDQRPDASTYMRYAEAARAFKAYEMAAEAYEAVLEMAGPLDYPQALFGLARCRQALGDYASAGEVYRQYLSNRAERPDSLIALAQQGRADSRWALEQRPDSLVRVTRLSDRLNSPYADFAPWMQNDTFYFTSYRFPLEDDRYQPPRKISKVLFSKDLRRGRPLGRLFNPDSVLTAHTAIDAADRRLYFTRCRFTEGARIRCELCYRERDRRGRWERGFTRLPAPVNLPGATATQPALRYDSLTGATFLLFVSDRPGVAGGFDFWETPVPPRGESWAEPYPVAALNTARDDISPFFHLPSQTLYFSSRRSPSFGGFDLFRANWRSDGWGPVENLGAPLNGSFDETYPFVQAGGQAGFFASTRPGGDVLDELSRHCCSDLFSFQRVSPTVMEADEPDTTLALTPLPAEAEPGPEPLPSTLEEFLPLPLYFDNDHPNPRTRASTTARTYEDTYRDYLEQETTYYDQFAEDEAAREALTTFFEEDVAGGFRRLERFSEILLSLLEDGQTVEIFLKGYTSPRARGDYNLLLGKRRVSAVRNHFERWRAGVFQPYLASGQLILSEVSFGETRAAANVRDERAGDRASIYDPAAARERRVEIVEVKRE